MCKWTLTKIYFTYGYFNPVYQIAIIFLCGGGSMVLASLSEPKWRCCCWEVSEGGGCRRTTIWALVPCCRMFASSSRVKLTADTLFTSTSLQTHTCKNTACQRYSDNILIMWCYWTGFSLCLLLQQSLNRQRWGLLVTLIEQQVIIHLKMLLLVLDMQRKLTTSVFLAEWSIGTDSAISQHTWSSEHLWCLMTCLLQNTLSQTWVLSTV